MIYRKIKNRVKGMYDVGSQDSDFLWVSGGWLEIKENEEF